jgi:hypothetical protein
MGNFANYFAGGGLGLVYIKPAKRFAAGNVFRTFFCCRRFL